MLRKAARLRAAEVRATLAQGRTVRQGGVSAKVAPLEGPSQAAVVVAKAFAKTAAERNRLRRLAYQALKESLPRRGVQAVFFIKEKDPNKLRADLASVCSKLTS